MRLIDADALKNKMLECFKNCFICGAYGEYYNGEEAIYLDAADLIDEAPTVEERKQGHWIRHDDVIACSECVFDMCFDENLGELNYCPYCGAEMRDINV